MAHDLLESLTRIEKCYRRGIISPGQALNQQIQAVNQWLVCIGRMSAAVVDAGAVAAGEMEVVHSDDLAFRQ